MEEKYIIVNEKQFLVGSDEITRDYFTGKWIEKKNADTLAKTIHLSKVGGLALIVDWAYTIDFHNFGLKKGHYRLKSVKGDYYLVKEYKVIGQGKLYPSIDKDHKNYILFDEITNKTMNNSNKFRAFDNNVYAFTDYDNSAISFEEKKLILERDIEFGVKSMTNKIFEGLNYTFGVELETKDGRLSEDDVDGLNLKCEFDGSLRENPDQNKNEVLGGEYITGILTGDAGMHQLQRICNILSERCNIGSKCGVHVHVGNIKFNKDNVVYMYILGELLQDEIFSMLPASRRTNTYCRKLKALGLKPKELNNKTPIMYNMLINEYFKIIFKDVSTKVPDRKHNKLFNHPQGSKCGYDKNSQRYSWLNFVPAMCDTRGNRAYTLEFRPMYATTNYIKVKHWVKICMAFVNFAENHQSSIKRGFWENKSGEKFPINLSTIIQATYPRTGRILQEYIEEKKNYFMLDNGEIELFEYKKDKEGVKNLTRIECV